MTEVGAAMALTGMFWDHMAQISCLHPSQGCG